MDMHKFLRIAAVTAACLPWRAAYGAFQYQSNIVEDDTNASSVHLPGCVPGSTLGNQTVAVLNCKSSGKVVIKPSKKKGDGGVSIQLVLTKVTCGGVPCNATNHVLELNVRALGVDVPSQSNVMIVAAAGVPFNLVNGKAAFANGKNAIGAGGLFGILASQIFTRSLGIGQIKLHATASNPADCNAPPLLAGNGCIDGAVYGVAGFPVPVDLNEACTKDADCPNAADVCTIPPGICTVESCASDTECRSGHCDINGGQCCVAGVTCP